jgi:hypothetical protein
MVLEQLQRDIDERERREVERHLSLSSVTHVVRQAVRIADAMARLDWALAGLVVPSAV